jgi:hypothetical protein
MLREIRLFLTWSAAVVGLVAVALGFWASSQTRPSQSRTQLWFRRKWCVLRDHSAKRFPELVIEWFVAMRNRLNSGVLQLRTAGDTPDFIPVLVTVSEPVLLLVGLIARHYATTGNPPPDLAWFLPMVFLFICSLATDWGWGSVACVVGSLSLAATPVFRGEYRIAVIMFSVTAALQAYAFDGPTEKRRWNELSTRARTRRVATYLIEWLLLYTLWVWFSLVVAVPPGAALIWSLILFPLAGTATLWGVGPLVLSADRLLAVDQPAETQRVAATTAGGLILFGLSASLSVWVSLLAITLGNTLEPLASIHQTKRLIVVNAVLDGLTVLLTLSCLDRGVKSDKAFSIPIAIAQAVLAGAAFACLSLWLGVRSMSHSDVWHVFLAHAPNGEKWQVGPYFWAMHSTFLPLAFYGGVVALCWCGKAAIETLELFFRRAQHEDINGLNMTSRFLALVATAMGLAASLVALAT